LIEDKNIKVARLFGLEKKAREARSQDELHFVIANETRQIIDYISAFLLLKTPADKFNIKATSDLATVDRTSPLLTFIENFVNNDKSLSDKEIQNLELDKIAKNINSEKPKNLPENILFIPIISPQKGLQGYLLLVRSEKFSENEIELAGHLSSTYGHAFNSFLKDFSIKNHYKKYLTGKKSWKIYAAIFIILILPIRITSTAPVEVIAKNPSLVTSPFDGVVKNIVASNNDKIKQGDLLVLLEDIELKNNLNITNQSLQVAQKELLRSRQSSFTNNEEKARLAELVAQVELKKVEVASAQEKLKNTKLFAKQKGIAIVDQKNDWQGRPVAVGEKIMTVANPDEVEFLIWLSVKESLVIKENSKVKVFLDINPISSLKGKLLRSSYEPSLSPEEILSYKLGASFEGKKPPRIGLRGTAKVYGSRVFLFYYVLRKPITFVRQLIGI